ncbi:uncharacterized protein LOC143496470 [Brachyhypopomus gauderio]|uniref:uncharacterized protein LOC143496470 n=1 Tax=Brachyhypopomus gauderio TaxID=698409 RepID=UPI0040412AC7
MERLCLLLVVIHITAGCMLSDNTTMKVKGHSGGSVLLFCSCVDLQTQPQSFTWRTLSRGHWTEVFRDERYRDRVQRFNELSPGNLSLLITDLREEDEGHYRCESEPRYFRYFTLRVSVRETGTHSWTSRTSPEVSPTGTVTSVVKEPPDLQTTHCFSPVRYILVLSILMVLILCILRIEAFIHWKHRGEAAFPAYERSNADKHVSRRSECSAGGGDLWGQMMQEIRERHGQNVDTETSRC